MSKKFMSSCAALALLGGAAFAFTSIQERPRPSRGGPQAHARFEGRHHGFGDRLRERMAKRREAIARHVRRQIHPTEAQREHFRTEAQAPRPTAEALRAEIREILQRARDSARGGDPKAARDQARTELKALLESYRARIEPSARSVVSQLTPEQRARLAEAAAKRGRTLDEERLKRGAALMLMHPPRHHGGRGR